MSPKTAQLTADEQAAVKVFKALGDPTRFGIVRILTHREEVGCGDMQALFGLSAPALSHHLRVLQECGLLTVRRDGAFHFFRLQRERLEHLAPGLLPAPVGQAS